MPTVRDLCPEREKNPDPVRKTLKTVKLQILKSIWDIDCAMGYETLDEKNSWNKIQACRKDLRL